MSDARKVLVTGVAGFIGSHVARVALLSGLAVRGTVRGKSYGIEEAVPGVELVEVDLLSSSEEDLVQALKRLVLAAYRREASEALPDEVREILAARRERRI